MNYLLALWEARPYLIKKLPNNRNALINTLLTDYTNFLIEKQRGNSKKTYDQIAAELNHSRSERETIEKLHRENAKKWLKEHPDSMNELMDKVRVANGMEPLNEKSTKETTDDKASGKTGENKQETIEEASKE